jgi:putative PEP-CTERM system TPR-repeat lipoprotein
MKVIQYIILSLVIFITACGDQKSVEQYLESGQNFYAKKDWKSAIIEFKNAVKKAPENAKARALLGKTYVQTFSSTAAIKELKKAKDLGYGSDDILVALGKAYKQSNQYQNIIDEIQIGAQQTPQIQADILALRAIAFIKSDNDTEALTILNKAKNLDSNATDVRLAWATYEAKKGNAAAEKEWLNPLLEREGGVADAWSMLGEIEQNASNFEAAEKAYTRSIDLRQYGHVDSVRRALMRIALKDYEGAQSDIDKLKKLGANWLVVGHTDGVIAFQTNKLDVARSRFQEVLSKAPEYPPSQFMLALIYFNEKNYQNAVTLLERYTSTNPENERAQFLYISTLLKLGQPENALSIIEKLEDQIGDDYRLLALKGNAYLQQKNIGKATEVLKKAVALKPEQAATRMQLGAILLNDKATFSQGQEELIKAIELQPDLKQAEFLLFKSYLAGKKYQDALDLAQNLDKKNPDNSQGANLVALTYLAQNQVEKAKNQLSKTLERFPADIVTSSNLARIYIKEKKLDKARDLYQNVLVKDKTHLQTLNQLALIAASEGDQEQMMKWLTQAYEGNKDVLSARLSLAVQYIRQNNPSQAVTLLNDAKESDKEQAGYILLLAQSKLLLKEQQHAIRLLKSLISQQPKMTAAHFLLAQAYAQGNQPEKMRESLQNTLELEPDNLRANLIMAKLDLMEGKYEDFKQRVNGLSKTHPENKDVQFLKAKVASGDKNYGRAISALESLMEESPHSEVVVDLAINQWQAGDKQSAISGLELWIQKNEKDTRALMLLAQYYLAENRENDAQTSYQKLDKLTPNNPTVLNNLAWLLKDSNPSQGIKYADQALKQNPESPFINDTLAMLYLASGENDKALQYSEKALELAPTVSDIRLNYARVLIANNQKDKAKTILKDLYSETRSVESRSIIQAELDKL